MNFSKQRAEYVIKDNSITGTSPNSGLNAQALAGAWNWLVDQCEAARKEPSHD